MTVTISGSTGVSLVDTNGVPTAAIQDSAVTPVKLTQKLTQGSAVATTSGTAIDFTGIPSWARRITLVLQGVSVSGSTNLLLRLGSGGTFDTTGYASQYNAFNNTPGGVGVTNGVQITGNNAASYAWNGVVQIVNVSGNIWVVNGTVMTNIAAATTILSGAKTLSGTLDSIRLLNTGADAFDAGSVNILYE
jgi:hypothetical protein